MLRSIFGTFVGVGFLLGAISGALAMEMPVNRTELASSLESMQFHSIEQPLRNKIAVTIGGLGLMGLELWWFLLSSKSQKI